MNASDSEVVLAVLGQAGYRQTADPRAADVVLVNTCAIRDNAEAKVLHRLGFYKNLKGEARRQRRPPPVVGVLGCMAERLKQRLLESDRLVDVVAGPDAYRCVSSLAPHPNKSCGRTVFGVARGCSSARPAAETSDAHLAPARPTLVLAAHTHRPPPCTPQGPAAPHRHCPRRRCGRRGRRRGAARRPRCRHERAAERRRDVRRHRACAPARPAVGVCQHHARLQQQ